MRATSQALKASSETGRSRASTTQKARFRMRVRGPAGGPEGGRERGLAGGEDVDGLAGHAVRVAPVQLAERPEEVREAADVVDVGVRDEDGADGGEVEARGVRFPGAVLARVEDIERLVDLQHQRRVVTAWLRLRAGAAP